MALYAFDGTWNSDRPGSENDTNVAWFHRAYQGNKHYWPGVGTRFGLVGKIAGGINGAGGHQRIREGLVALTKNFMSGDTVVDIVGFSRGAAIAVDFANEVAKQTGLPGPSPAAVRFLGVWDIVGSFDVPGDAIDLGFDFGTPPTAAHCVHCMALDERRRFFPLTRMSGSRGDDHGRLLEVWFRGVHSDVGGGDAARGLSSIALNFMFVQASRAGVLLDRDVIAENARRIDATYPISLHPQHALEQLEPFRTIRATDTVHVSVTARADKDGRHYHNPQASLRRINDDGGVVAATHT
jgi:uncharacterized protein (DUF2235 family)